ncbi:MAG TPA: RNA-guided endonuclease TnpB family protein [Pseudonocardiaceae bacterium]|nr:RNA-guided endonuclease TnpB family protein [Pseudonocardiaceae bacterium]
MALLPSTTAAVGVDAGITGLLTLDHPIPGLTDDQGKIDNPRHERRDRHRLAAAQRVLAREAAGSRNRDKARRKVARVRARIVDRRRDLLHQLSTRLVRENQTIVIEDLAVANMVRNHKVARAIQDASWSVRHLAQPPFGTGSRNCPARAGRGLLRRSRRRATSMPAPLGHFGMTIVHVIPKGGAVR